MKTNGLVFLLPVVVLLLFLSLLLTLPIRETTAVVVSGRWRVQLLILEKEPLTFYTCHDETNPACERVETVADVIKDEYSVVGNWDTDVPNPALIEHDLMMSADQFVGINIMYALFYDLDGEIIGRSVSEAEFLARQDCKIGYDLLGNEYDECGLLSLGYRRVKWEGEGE